MKKSEEECLELLKKWRDLRREIAGGSDDNLENAFNSKATGEGADIEEKLKYECKEIHSELSDEEKRILDVTS